MSFVFSQFKCCVLVLFFQLSFPIKFQLEIILAIVGKTKYQEQWEKDFSSIQKVKTDCYSAFCKKCPQCFRIDSSGICQVRSLKRVTLKVVSLNKILPWKVCLRESEGDHKLESHAITAVAYRQKTKTKRKLLKMSVK